MHHTVILVPSEDESVDVYVPTMPGCLSTGRTRAEALEHAKEAMAGWLEAEAIVGRGPLPETPEIVAGAVAEALAIIEAMRRAGEAASDRGYELALVNLKGLPRQGAEWRLNTDEAIGLSS